MKSQRAIIDVKPKVGIIIPVYKTKYEYLKQCVESIVNQTYKNLQIILVDDCSPDDCPIWCDEFAKTDNRIEVFHHDRNKKLPEARNTGISHLKSEWAMFVDSDDWLDTDTISCIVSKILTFKKNVDFAFFPICRNYKNKETNPNFNDFFVYSKNDIERLQLDSLEIAKKTKKNSPRMNDGAWGKIISTRFLRKNNISFKNLAYREDGMFYMELCESAECVLAIPEGKYHYRETKGSMVNSFRVNAPEEQKTYINLLVDFSTQRNKSLRFKQGIYYYSLVSIQTVIVQFYYNEQNKMRNRRKELLLYMKQEPFLNGLKHIRLFSLNSHFMAKAFLIKIHCFGFMDFLRKFYLKRNKKECYE